MRILIDMDEVLADFVGHAAYVHGLLGDPRPPGHWSVDPWMTIDWDHLGYTFWTSIPPLPWADALIALVSELTEDWHIITSPVNSHNCYRGKVTWIKRFFGEDFDRFCITPHKHLFAHHGVYLIDDRQTNIDQFRAAGGDGFLFPSQGNSLYAYKRNPVDYLSRYLHSYFSKELSKCI
jgi:5'(3')-deoxyribonucleotidase